MKQVISNLLFFCLQRVLSIPAHSHLFIVILIFRCFNCDFFGVSHPSVRTIRPSSLLVLMLQSCTKYSSHHLGRPTKLAHGDRSLFLQCHCEEIILSVGTDDICLDMIYFIVLSNCFFNHLMALAWDLLHCLLDDRSTHLRIMKVPTVFALRKRA